MGQKSKTYFSDIIRRVELLNDLLNGKPVDAADFAEEQKVSSVTVARDLQWFRANGISVYSRKGKIILSGEVPTEFRNALLSEYLSVRLSSAYFNEKIHAISKTHPEIYFNYLTLLSKAVEEKRMIKIEYFRISDDKKRNYIIQPVELFNRGNDWILKAVKKGEQKIKFFYVTRFNKIELTDKYFSAKDFYEDAGNLIDIELLFDANMKSQLIDKIWFDKYEIEETREGKLLLKTTQPLTNGLAAWCISWWHKIEIISPQELKDYIEEMFEAFKHKNVKSK